jgi:folate-binding protein YgfZ
VVHELGDVMLLVVPPARKDVVLARLDQFIFSEDVQLGDVSDTFVPLDIVGPEAAQRIGALLDVPVDSMTTLKPDGAVRATFRGDPVIVRRISDFGMPAFELLAGRDQSAPIHDALRSSGVSELDDAAAEALRVEAGFPLFGRDMDEDTIPLEAGIEGRAISFTKGCYVGQEVIIRVLHRGHGRVARKLVGIVFDRDVELPPPASALLADEKEIGTITSSVFSPAIGRPIALAYLKRDFVAPGTRVVTTGGGNGEVVALPFVTR